jgi:electron transfer flavoprotein alpha subunit
VLTLGRKVAASLEAALGWLVLGPMPEGTAEVATRYGVAGIHRIEDAKLESFEPDAHVEALAQYCAQHAPKVLLFVQEFDVRLVAPRLAGRSGAGVVMNAVDLVVDTDGRLSVTASAYGGDTRVVYSLTNAPWYVVAVTATAIEAKPSGAAAPVPTVLDVRVDLGGVEERVRVVGRAETEGPRVEDAEIIVAGGRGLGSVENYRLVEDLARALGGMSAATRPIVDDGWVDPSRQVGLTGKITRPNLYVAAGISGASQHMVGCAAAKAIVAINRDPEAAIFRYARYGIVGDCLAVLPELVRAIKA